MTPMQLIVLAHLAFSQLPVCTFTAPQGFAGALSAAVELPKCLKGDVLTDQQRVQILAVDGDGTVVGAFAAPCRRLRPT